MSEKDTRYLRFPPLLLILLILRITGCTGDSLETDRQVLLSFKSFLEQQNRVNRGRYTEWNLPEFQLSPCNWTGISCDDGGRVSGIVLSDSDIAGDLFGNFSAITRLTHLDLSLNTISGEIPADLGSCQNLRFLNLSNNMITGELNLTGLNSLETLDLSVNRINGEIRFTFPSICDRLVVANISSNKFSGELGNSLGHCQNLLYADLSSNSLTGNLSYGFERLREFVVSENNLSGTIPPRSFTENCSLTNLDLAENLFFGEFPGDISNCRSLEILNLWGNNFTGRIPQELGSTSSLVGLFLGKNSFSREIPESLLNLSSMVFLDVSRNNFGGDIQDIFGRFTQVEYLLLHGNSYTGGLYSSGILDLANISRLDLSYNNFSGPLPVELSQMPNLKYLFLAANQFVGNIPSEYGNLPSLQAIDLSYNKLNGSIPTSFGRLTSLLWLMLANNSLTGEIPQSLGNCSSLLWFNVANNQLIGRIPAELTNIGNNPTPTFQLNQQNDRVTVGSGECFAMRRWIPANYPPFSFVYAVLTRKKCRVLWDRLLKGYGVFPTCVPGSSVRSLDISGYVQLSGNQLSGEVPREIGNMRNFSMLHLGLNQFNGTLPREIGQLPLTVLNISQNGFSGDIPTDVGGMKCLQNLDMSYNNFSGSFPTSLNNLTELSKFNISYNPYITGVIPSTGQLSTFERWSFIGDPLLRLPSFIENTTNDIPGVTNDRKKHSRVGAFFAFMAILLAFLVCGIMTLLAFLMVKSPRQPQGYFMEGVKVSHDQYGSSSGESSSWLTDKVKVIRLDKTAFTYADILMATLNFSDERIVGVGGSGVVYRGMLRDGREIAVKKLQRDGLEGEREFRAEMEALSGDGSSGWPHPNLVILYGWCLFGSEKLLIYEYMKGGSLEDLISDTTKLTWRHRVDLAIDVARALVFLHHECFPPIVHRDVKASNVLLDKNGKARVTDFGLARVVDSGGTHVSTMVAGTVGYVAPEYGQTWQATTKGDVYSYGVLVMELATGRRAVDGGDESLVEWGRRVTGNGRPGFNRFNVPNSSLASRLVDGADEMRELLNIGIRCTAEIPAVRPNMKQVLLMLFEISTGSQRDFSYASSSASL
jgi:Leucine-rich repeat (LRR) protein